MMMGLALRDAQSPGMLPPITNIMANGDCSTDREDGMATACWAHLPGCKDWPQPCHHSHIVCCGMPTRHPLGLCSQHLTEILG